MLYKRKGYPVEDEIVLCRVNKIYPNSVFVDLLEYDTLSGIVYISEVAPGRIRNLRDYVSDGRQIICKVLRVDQQKGHIDLSLRRVNSTQRQEKLDEIKQELKAEALIKNIAAKLKRQLPELYKEITTSLFREYSHLYLCFKDIVADAVDLQKLGLEKKLAEELRSAVMDKFKPKKIMLKSEISLQTYSSEGVDKIRSILSQIENVSPTISVAYLGGGRYKLTIEDFDYKLAEKTLKQVAAIIEQFNDKLSTGSLQRQESS